MGNQDRLSNLPLSIILDILSRVPIRDAIGTSFLSRKWRFTWTNLPRLLFSGDDVDPDSVNDELMTEIGNSTNNFISNVLIHHRGPIHSFIMSYPFYFNMDCAEEWIHCLSRNDIRELTIEMYNEDDDSPPSNLLKSGIYSCTKLTKLELSYFEIDSPPSTFKGFLFLTSLVLREVELSSEGVERLVDNCPLLERLAIISCSIKEVKIRSRYLKDLEVAGRYTKLCLYAPLVVKMTVVLLGGSQFAPENQSSVCNYSNFFLCGGFTNLVKLSGDEFFIQYLSIGIESCHSTIVFHHLEALDLCLPAVNFLNTKEVAVFAHLIIGAPNLRKLYISTGLSRHYGSPCVPSKNCFEFAPNFTLEKLTDVCLSFVCGYRWGMQLIKFLLGSSPVLETMELVFPGPDHNVSAELSGFYRASPNARILFS